MIEFRQGSHVFCETSLNTIYKEFKNYTNNLNITVDKRLLHYCNLV